ncbi:MAG: KTSC domain-containing protein [Rhizomicrobium sp.]
MPALDSEALLAVHYDERHRLLRATFRTSRKTCVYKGVAPDVYAALMAARSRGAWFNANIRDHYPFEEVKQFGRRGQ